MSRDADTASLPTLIDLPTQAAAVDTDWHNWVVAEVNDHVVRASVLGRDFHWHAHPDSDELFYVVDGRLWIDFEEGTVELGPGQLLKVPRGVRHRTRPASGRSVNLTFEAKGTNVCGEGP